MTRSGSDPLRILYVEANEDGTVGGSYQALFDLVTSLDRTRFEPIVLFYEDCRFATALRTLGIEAHIYQEVRAYENRVNQSGSLGERLWKLGRAILTRRRTLAELRIDGLHLNNSPRVGCDDWLPAAKWHGCPILVTAMGDPGLERSHTRRWLVRRYDRVLAISENVRSQLIDRGIPKEIIRLTYLGIDIDGFKRRAQLPAQVMRRALDVEPDDFLILMPGNVKDWKGQHVLVQALTLLPESILVRTQVRFAGDTPIYAAEYRASLELCIRNGGLENRVRFLGERQDMPDLMAAADVVVHASTIPEPFGLVVVEAMSLARPVIASQLGGPAEIIVEGTGLLFDPARPEELAAHLHRLAEDGRFRHSLGLAAAKRAMRFDVSANVRATVQAYNEVFD